MFGAYLTRGVAAGVVAGLLFGLLLALVANPLVGYAEAAGHGDDAPDHDETHESLVSAGVADAVSVVSGVLWGVLLGGVVFGAGYFLLEPILPGEGAVQSYVLGAAGFVGVSGAPWLLLPPRPPGVGATLPPETRVTVYAGGVAVGCVAYLLAFWTYDRLRATRDRRVAGAAALVPLSLLLCLAAVGPVEGTAATSQSALAAGLTGVVVFGQLLLWATLATVHAGLRHTPTAAPWFSSTPGD